MKDVIGNILDIENKANEIIEAGKSEKIRLEKEMNANIEKMQEEINIMVKAKLDELDLEEKKDAKESLERINSAAEKQLAEMERFYRENKDSWVESVFNIVIGSEKSGS